LCGNTILGDVILGRLEKFREARRFKIKYMYTFLLIFILLVSGICIVDYSVNNLLKNSKNIGIISAKTDETELEISILNYKLRLNTKYINRDINKLKSFIKKAKAKR
jgi:hypothetical protein